jgi:hypothetical protein
VRTNSITVLTAQRAKGRYAIHYLAIVSVSPPTIAPICRQTCCSATGRLFSTSGACELRADEFILIGASTEGAVEATALGLLQRGKRVRVVVDASGLHNKKEAKLALRKMEAKGAKLVETKKLAGVSHLRQVGVCNCDSCQRRPKKSPA